MLLYQAVGLLGCVLVAYARSPSKVIAGYDVDAAHFPFFAKIETIDENGGTLICGGTIIHPRYILTAAHCLENYEAQNLAVTVGSQSEYEKTYKAEKLIKHGGYDDGGYHDIGLLKTTEEIVYHVGHVEPVELTSKDYRDDGYPVELVGYGYTAISIDFPSKLQWLATTIYDQKKCEAEKLTVKDERWICTLEEEGKGFCYGDSGGPLLANGVQIGIIAHGACAKRMPHVFTRIYHYLDWIRDQLNN